MRGRALLLASLAAVLLLTIHCSGRDASKRYQEFAEEVLHRHYDKAAAMCAGITESELARRGTQEQIGAGPPMFQTLFPSSFEITETTTPNGDIHIDAVQTVLFNPGGVESAVRPAMYAKMKQTADLRKIDGTWKIVTFANKFDSMDSTSSR